MPNGMMSNGRTGAVPRLPLPMSPTILVPPLMPQDTIDPRLMPPPAGMPSQADTAEEEQEREFVPGPWCLGADTLCTWLLRVPVVGFQLASLCRVVFNVLCLIVGIALITAIVGLLLFAFLQPG